MNKEPYYTGETNEIPEGSNLGFKIGISITIFIVACAFFVMIDWAAFDGRLCANWFSPNNCEFQLPPGWEIMSNGKTYIVRYKTKLHEDYLTGVPWEIEKRSYKAVRLKSECKAKGYLRLYLKQTISFEYKVLNNDEQ